MFLGIICARGGLTINGRASLLALSTQRAFVLVGLLLIVLTGCTGAQSATPTPEATLSTSLPVGGTAHPVGNGSPTATGGPTPPAPTSTALPAATPTQPAVNPSQTPAAPPDPPTLQVVSPADASGLEVGFARVMGTTSGTSVRINGLPTEVAPGGDFQRDLSLQEGVNFIEVAASDEFGQRTVQQITVFVVAPTANLPFTILYPRDGLEVASPTVPVVGVTRPDAVVGVNDVPVEIDASGIFSTSVELEEGANLIEVVAADIEGNVRFQTVAVFHLP